MDELNNMEGMEPDQVIFEDEEGNEYAFSVSEVTVTFLGSITMDLFSGMET